MNMRNFLSRLLGGLLFVSLCALAARAADPPGLNYNRDVKPILADNCFRCHGPDSAARKADLRLDKRDAAIAAKAFIPGKPGDSESVRRILSTDPDEIMPPPKSRRTLTPQQKDILQKWVAAGAEYQPHWSFIAPVRSPLPTVKNAAWAKTPIDHFILARLEAAGLAPAPEADRRSLARRLSLDLTGLPPEPALVEAFVADADPKAYEKLVDKLMESPHWGEHRGRYWLDAARYADTHGIHFDNFREVWAYRDWVISAFNRNLPYDQFTIEQLAGDLLPNRTVDQQVASGFNRCNITTNEGGTIPEEYLVLYARDRVETTSAVWLGMNAGCAVCHSHKFDPLTMKDFYSMAAFFNNTTQNAMDGNIKDTPPVIQVARTEDRPRSQLVESEIAAAKKAAEDRRAAAKPDFDAWLASAMPNAAAADASVPQDGLKFHAPLSEGQGDIVHLLLEGKARELKLGGAIAWEAAQAAAKALKTPPGAIELAEVGDFENSQAFTCGAWIKLDNPNQSGSVVARMDDKSDYRGWDLWVQQGRIGSHVIHKWPTDAVKVVSKQSIKRNEWTHVLVTYDGSKSAAGLKIFINGAPQETETEANTLKNSTHTTVPFKVATRHSSGPLHELAIHDVRLYGKALIPAEVQQLARSTRLSVLLAKPTAARTPEEQNEIYSWWLFARDKIYQSLQGKITALEKEQLDIKARGTIAHVMQERNEAALAYILTRGDYDKRGEKVTPNTPDFLPAMPPELPRNRLGFAQWLLRPENPLTARVEVNRAWQELFGTGIVKTAGDFGAAGEIPSHPELLDWLAVEFRESGWNVKQLYKLMVMSAAYRQAGISGPEKQEKDPQNRLLSRGPRFRMDAEMVRDYALAASGLLVPKIGGPSVKPYQPDGVWEAVAMIGSNTRDYRRDTGENLYRRSMYTFWKRAAPPASMEVFNAPNRETCAVRRERTNTPLQALVTLNDPQFVEAARHLAQRALLEGGPADAQRIDFIVRRLLARPLRPEEQKIVETSLADLTAYYQQHADDARKLIAVGESKSDPKADPVRLAGLTMLVNQLLNLDEVLCK